MKPLLHLTLFALLSIGRANDIIGNIQIDAEFIEAPEAAITSILHSADAPKSGREWRTTIEKWLKDSSAKLAGSVSVTTKSGNRASCESVKELTYATEFDPAKGRAGHAPAVPKSITGSDVPTPTAFEMRPVGIRMEVEPTLSPDGTIIDLNIAPEVTEKVDESVHQQIPLTEKEMLATMKQPVFHTMKVAASVAVTNGGSTLAAILIPHTGQGDIDPTRRILCLVSARTMGL